MEVEDALALFKMLSRVGPEKVWLHGKGLVCHNNGIDPPQFRCRQEPHGGGTFSVPHWKARPSAESAICLHRYSHHSSPHLWQGNSNHH
eukprot:superscaffoldBa00000308_g3661